MAYSEPQGDRRSRGRTTADRREQRTRLEGVCTDVQRRERVEAIRDELHDSRAITVKRTDPGSNSARVDS